MAALGGVPALQAPSLHARASLSAAGKAHLALGKRPGQQKQQQQGLPRVHHRHRQQGQQRRSPSVRAAGFEGPERAEPDTVVIKTLTAPSSWPGAESPIGPGMPWAYCPPPNPPWIPATSLDPSVLLALSPSPPPPLTGTSSWSHNVSGSARCGVFACAGYGVWPSVCKCRPGATSAFRLASGLL